jgi:signal transduction histidine kinase
VSQTVITSNKLALISFTSVLVIFLVIVDIFMIVEERDFLLQMEKSHAKEEMDIMGKLLTEAMIRSDYATVEQYVPQWSKARPDVVSVRVIAPNGFVVTQHQRKPGSEHLYELNSSIRYLDKPVLKLEMQWDFGTVHNFIKNRLLKLLSISVVTVAVLGWLLWRVLKITAIDPLQREIAEREKVENQLAEHTKELASHVEELESYSYSIAHDLRAPVRSITSFSQILKTDIGDKLASQEQDVLQRIIAAGKYMAELIDDILALSRITRVKLAMEPLALSKMAEESIADSRHLEPGRDCEIVIQPNLSAKGDPKLVRLLLENLLDNAWKYTANQPHAHIEFGMEMQSQPVFYIRDNGVGFDMQYVDKIFQPFQRLHAHGEFEGTGIGLATAMRIVKRHGGEIWAKSELNKGATFYFTLPLA